MSSREELLRRIDAAKESKAVENAATLKTQEDIQKLHDRVLNALKITDAQLTNLTSSNRSKRDQLLSSQNDLFAAQANENETLFTEAATSGIELSDEEKNEITQESKRNIKGATKEEIKAAHSEWKEGVRDAKMIENIIKAFTDITDDEKKSLDKALQEGNLTAVKEISKAISARTEKQNTPNEAELTEINPEALMNKMETLADSSWKLESEVKTLYNELASVSNKLKDIVNSASSVNDIDKKFSLSTAEKTALSNQPMDVVKARQDEYYSEHIAAVSETLNNPEGKALIEQFKTLHKALLDAEKKTIDIRQEFTSAAKLFLEQTAKPERYIPIMDQKIYAQKDLEKIPKISDMVYRGFNTDPQGLTRKIEKDRNSYLITDPGSFNAGLSNILNQK